MESWHELSRQCVATNREGQRCGRPPIVGGSVCAMHGGKNPDVVAAARQRLLTAVEPALDALFRILKHGPPCAVCGRTDSDKNPVVLNAAKAVLDRCGFGPQMSLEISRAEVPRDPRTLDQIIADSERILEVARQMRDAKLIEDNTIDVDPIESELIDEEN